MDNYYKDQDDLSIPLVNGQKSFDQPGSFRLEDLRQDIINLCLGKPIELPLFDISQNKRVETKIAFPAKYILVEGLYASLVSNVITNSSQKLVIKLESDQEKIFNRRIKRDMEKGLTFNEAVEIYTTLVKPENDRFINQQKFDLIIKNNFEKI